MMLGAIILAAGLSSRMGNPKMLLPWKNSTVLESVIETLGKASLEQIVVVTGGFREEVETLVVRWGAKPVFNPKFENGEMLYSIKTGLAAVRADIDAVFIALGDQPQIEEKTVVQIRQLYEQTLAPLIVPSYDMKRGHPWLVDKSLWRELIELPESETMRDFLNKLGHMITYQVVDTPSILKDLDTPEDYKREIGEK